VTSSLANGVDRYRDHQDHRHQDDRHRDHPDHQDRHRDDLHQDHQNHHQDDQHPDHQDDLVRHQGDQRLDHSDDQRQDHQVRVCQGQMDALAHRYLLVHDQVHLLEYDQCEHQHLGQQDDHPSADDQHPALHLDDQEVAELDDHCLEEAELDDQMDPFEVVVELSAQQALLPEQAQLLPQEFVELLKQLQLAALVQELVPVLQQVQP